jgi:hypothetical protein
MISPEFAALYKENSNGFNLSWWVLSRLRQVRLRVIQIKKMKTATNPTATSIQFCASKPKIAKCPMRNCTVPAPAFCAKQAIYLCSIGSFWKKDIIFILYRRAGRSSR